MGPPEASTDASPAALSSSSLLCSLDALEAIELRFWILRAGPDGVGESGRERRRPLSGSAAAPK